MQGLVQFAHTHCHGLRIPSETIKPKRQNGLPELQLPGQFPNSSPIIFLLFLWAMTSVACLLTQAHKWKSEKWLFLMPINQFLAYSTLPLFGASLPSRKWDRRSQVAAQGWFFPLIYRVLGGFISKQQACLTIRQKQTKSQSLREYKHLGASPVCKADIFINMPLGKGQPQRYLLWEQQIPNHLFVTTINDILIWVIIKISWLLMVHKILPCFPTCQISWTTTGGAFHLVFKNKWNNCPIYVCSTACLIS